MTAETHDAIVQALVARMPHGKWFTLDEAVAALEPEHNENDVVEVIDDLAQIDDELEVRRVHDDHTLYRIQEDV
jgi:ABC-type hemin transport system ATPase subunit